MTDHYPRVTVVIPTRDRWHLLPTALEAVFCQEGVGADVVVVDDGSALRRPPEIPCADGAVQIVRSDVSHGLAGARNAGIAHATGDWIAFLDDDDIWSPDKLRLQIAAASRAAADWAYSTAVMLDPEGLALYVWPLPEPETLLERLVGSNAIPAGSSNVVVRATLLRSLGGFDPAFSRIADWDLWLRLASTTPAAAVDEPLVGYRQHTANMSGSGRQDLLVEFAALAAKHGELAVSRGLSFDAAGVEEWAERERRRGVRSRVREHLRCGQRFRAAGVFVGAGVRHRDVAGLMEGFRLATERLRGPIRPDADQAAYTEQPEWVALYRRPR